jgi:hypothetical protein
MKKSWKNLVSRGLEPHRLGAALTLSLMPKNVETDAILRKASRSAFWNVRAAFREAQKRLAASGS